MIFDSMWNICIVELNNAWIHIIICIRFKVLITFSKQMLFFKSFYNFFPNESEDTRHCTISVYFYTLFSFSSFLSMTKYINSSDTRRGLCYTQVRRGQCSNPSFTAVTKSTCCCMEDNSNNGWGYPCEVCPKPGDPHYRTVCPHGPGKNGNGGGKQVYLI